MTRSERNEAPSNWLDRMEIAEAVERDLWDMRNLICKTAHVDGPSCGTIADTRLALALTHAVALAEDVRARLLQLQLWAIDHADDAARRWMRAAVTRDRTEMVDDIIADRAAQRDAAAEEDAP